MMSTRKGAAPYPAQLKRYLAKLKGPATFSAASLESEFEQRPREDRRGRINSIHQALRREWEAGTIVAFVGPDGSELREQALCVNGSAAVAHPQIYGIPGTDSPDPAYAPVSYDEYLTRSHERSSGNGDGSIAAAEEASPEQAAENAAETEENTTDAEPEDGDTSASTEEDQAQAIADAKRKIDGYKVSEPAPSWLPDRLLAHLVSLPEAARVWRLGLDQAQNRERLALIRAGVRRKGEVDSLAAARLTKLCREDRIWWSRAFQAAIDQYIKWDEAIPDESLPELAEAPDDFCLAYEDDYSPEVIVLWGMLLRAPESALAEVAELAASGLEDEEVEDALGVEDRLRHRADSLEAEIAELRSQLDAAEDGARSQRVRAESLQRDLESARDAVSEAGSIDERLRQSEQRAGELSQELAEARGELEAASAAKERARELEQQLTAAEHERDQLAVHAAAAHEERARRHKAESRLQEQAAELRQLEDELQTARQSGVLVPVEDPGTLLRSLARPIGEAAALAAKRIAAGTAKRDDPRLLSFSGSFGELVTSLGGEDGDQPEAPPPAEKPAPVEAETETSTEPPPVKAEATLAAAAPPPVDGQPTPVAETPEPTAEPEAPAAHRPSRGRGRRRSALFTITPLGGAGEVGGSALLVQTRAGDTVLLDAGQRVKGEYGIDGLSPFHFTLPGVEHLDAIAISHAHIDHVGSLPVVWEDYQRRRDNPVPVYMSEPTLALSRIMLEDSAKIQHKHQYLTSGAMHELVRSDFAHELDLRPAYDRDKVNAVLEAVTVAEPHLPHRIADGRLTIKLMPVSHVLGSCAIHLTDNDSGATLLYTGDLGPFSEPQRTLQPLDFDSIEPADVVIIESTYARLDDSEREGRRAPGRDEALDELFKAARRAQANGGHVLLPAFSLGRTQELLQIIEDYSTTGELPKGTVFIGGMGERIVQTYSAHRGSVWSASSQMSGAEELHRSLKGGGRTLDEVVDERVSSEQFSYFIVSPALLSGGWSRAFLRRMVDEERHSVVFTGYMPRHAGNIRNFAGKHTGAPIRFDEDGRQTKIECAWRKALLSAHAPARDLHAVAKRMLKGGKEVAFGTVHGNPEAQQALASYIDGLDGASASSLENGVPWSPQRG